MLFRVGITRRGSGYGELLHGNNGRGLTRFALKSVDEVLPSAVIASSPDVFAAASAAAAALVEEVLSSVERRRM